MAESVLHNHAPNMATTTCPACIAPRLVGLRDEDIYSFDNYLAGVLAEGLRKLREMGNSYPPELEPEQWTDTLDKMAAGFEQWAYAEDHGELPNVAQLDESLDLLRRWFKDLWD